MNIMDRKTHKEEDYNGTQSGICLRFNVFLEARFSHCELEHEGRIETAKTLCSVVRNKTVCCWGFLFVPFGFPCQHEVGPFVVVLTRSHRV